MKTIIEVTKKDIVKGKRYSERSCPIALALKRNGLKDVRVCSDTFRAVLDGAFISVHLPGKATAFIEKFDEAKPVRPFKFALDI